MGLTRVRLYFHIAFFSVACLLADCCLAPRAALAQIETENIAVPRIEMTFREIRDIPVPGLREYVLTQSGVVNIEQIPGNVLRLEAVGQGSTFLHIWDSSGRRTLEILVRGLGPSEILTTTRKGFKPGGAKFTYSFRMDNDRIPGIGWQDPIYEHDFESYVPLRGDQEWNTILRALTNPQIKSGPAAAPFSQATEPTYMLSYYRTRRFLIGAGDVSYYPGDLSITGFSLRGGLFQMQSKNGRDRLQVFGGWSRPPYGNNEFLEVTPQQLYGVGGRKELIPGIALVPSFSYLNQSSSPPQFGQTFQNDFVGTLGVEANPLNSKWTVEAEYGRSKDDNAFRGLVEYRPFWGRILGTFRRVGTNYVTLAQGFLLKDFQEADFVLDAQPFRTIDLTFNYQFFQFGLSSNPAIIPSFNHAFFLSGRWRPNENNDYIGSFSVSRNTQSGLPSNGSELGIFSWQHFFAERRSNLFIQASGEHDFRGATLGPGFDRLGGELQTRYQRNLSEHLRMYLTQDLEVNRIREADTFGNPDSFLQTFFSYGPSFTWEHGGLSLNGGFYHSMLFSGPQDFNFIQPYFSAYFSPNQALTFGTRANLNYDFRQTQLAMNLTGELVYRFGPGVPDNIASGWSRSGKIRGTVFRDENGDGQRGPEEALLEGFTVQLDGGTPVAAAGGLFQFKTDPGRHQVLLNIPEGYQAYRLTVPNPQDVTVTIGSTAEVPFGLTEGMQVQGRLILDVNENGKVDADEFGVLGTRVRVSGENFSQTVAVPASGVFQAFVPKPGNYRVEISAVDLPSAYRIAGPAAAELRVGPGEFAQFPALLLQAKRYVAGRAFLDVDGDGKFSPADKPLPGIRVQLGRYSTSTTTDGTFLLSGIGPGSYLLQVSPNRTQGYELKAPKELSFEESGKGIELNLPYEKSGVRP
ncbi:MAG: carboxypeptidase-like regulatory domain-containing protein [bacterium]